MTVEERPSEEEQKEYLDFVHAQASKLVALNEKMYEDIAEYHDRVCKTIAPPFIKLLCKSRFVEKTIHNISTIAYEKVDPGSSAHMN